MFERRLLKPFCFICVFIGIKSAGVFESQVSKLSSYKVVIPQIVHHQWKRYTHHSEETEQAVKTDRLTYSLNIEEKDHVLHLERNKDFLAKDFVQYTYDDNGNLVTAYPGVHNHCYYHGWLEGHKDSWLALSTCLGLRGVIFFGNKSYGLEPVIQSPTNEHLLFPLKQSQSESGVCGVSNQTPDFDTHNLNDPTLSMTRLLRKKRNLPQTRYVELVLVVDKRKYDTENGNFTAVKNQMVELANLLDGYYQQLNIRVALVGLEILNSGNPFNVDGLAGEVLGNFVTWRKSVLLPRIRHDVGQLVVGRTSSFSGGILGMAFVGTVCSASTGGGISAFVTGSSLVFFSTVVAHEMGHNMGMNHDQGQCTCGGGGCIMDPTAGGSTKFSNCSGNYFELLILRGGGICLKNVPPPSSIITTPTCGNGMLEEGEQCDCGQPQDCNDKCCDAATCRFTPGSRCSQGSCCSECQIKVSGTPCRTSVDTCDLPEFCNGQSAFCPSDYYIMDGLQCDDNTAYCFEGRCQTFDFQCKHLFGNNARKAADVCFNTINGNGDQFGNCGLIGSTYIKCSVANSLCGKVQCTNVDTNFPPTGAIVSVQNVNGEKCVNADFNLGPDVRDPAYVNPGSLCATGKTCLDFKCTNASALRPNFSCDAQGTCNGHGVCNNLGNCHCDDGWAPPFCNTWGRGGSVDSGPAQIDYSLRNGLLIFFLLVVPVLILITVVLLYVFRRDWLTRCKRRRSRRSPTTTNNPATAQRNSTPQPQAQTPTRPPQPPISYPRATPVVESSYSNLNFGRTTTPQPVLQQGPGVPKPIPPKQALPIPRA